MKETFPMKELVISMVKPLVIDIIKREGAPQHGVMSVSYINLKAHLEEQIGEIFASKFISSFLEEDEQFDLYFASDDTGSRYYVAIQEVA